MPHPYAKAHDCVGLRWLWRLEDRHGDDVIDFVVEWQCRDSDFGIGGRVVVPFGRGGKHGDLLAAYISGGVKPSSSAQQKPRQKQAGARREHASAGGGSGAGGGGDGGIDAQAGAEGGRRLETASASDHNDSVGDDATLVDDATAGSGSQGASIGVLDGGVAPLPPLLEDDNATDDVESKEESKAAVDAHHRVEPVYEDGVEVVDDGCVDEERVSTTPEGGVHVDGDRANARFVPGTDVLRPRYSQHVTRSSILNARRNRRILNTIKCDRMFDGQTGQRAAGYQVRARRACPCLPLHNAAVQSSRAHV